MAKKSDEILAEELDKQQTFNPLLNALRENDKKNLFQTNVRTAFIKTGFPLIDYYFGSVINIHDNLGGLVKQEARVGQAAGTFNLIIGNSGCGKAQPLSTPIPTPNGWKKMGDLKVGDEVFTYDGSVTKIDGVFPQGEQDIYQIAFNDGRTSECTADHLWTVLTSSHEKYRFQTLSLRDMINETSDGICEFKTNYYIPTLFSPLQYPHRDVPIDPYTIGALIGNGVLGDKMLTVSSGDEWVPLKIAKNNGFKHHKICDKNYDYWFYDDKGNHVNNKRFFSTLPEMVGTQSHNKRIPEIYLHNDPQTRLELLRGLMDTDGSIAKTKTGAGNLKYDVSYSSCSEGLLNDIIELIQSFGYTANINVDSRVEKYRHGYHGSITIQAPAAFKMLLFTHPNKFERAKDAFGVHCQSKRRERKYDIIHLLAIKKVRREEAQCIHITNHSHLYVTDQGILTHNTTLAAQIAANIIRQYKYANVIHFDCENRFDVSRCETITKLPASFFDENLGERYMIKSGMVGLDTIQEMIVKTYVSKMKLKKELTVDSGFKDEFGREVMILEPTVIIIDSITTVMSETFNPDNAKEAAAAEQMRGNTEGARDAKTMKGFFKDILPMCKEANIIVYGINHINMNMSMNAFTPVAKQQNYLKQDESIPGGKTMIYYPFNIIKLTARPSDDFTEDGDGFTGHMVMVEPVKSSSNQSGNNSKGIAFELVFSHKYGFDSLRSMIMYGRDNGIVEGNRNRLKFKADDSFTFTFKDIYQEAKEKPIWENIKKYIIPDLNRHLPFIEPGNDFDVRSLDY